MVIGAVPDSFRVVLETSRGPVIVAVYRAWAPHGAERFYRLVAEGFFDDQRFFRVLPGYIAQFGASGVKDRDAQWRAKKIPDDPRVESNARGTLSFASDGANARAHQLFFNLKDNPKLDADGFVPIGRVVEGMGAVDSIYNHYGQDPRYHLITSLGNSYLQRMFPKLDYIKTARVVGGVAAGR